MLGQVKDTTTLTSDIQPVDRLPPKALARKIVDAAVAEAEAEEDNLGEFIDCDIGKAGDFDVVVKYNDMDGAQVEIWNHERNCNVPDAWLNPDEVSAMIQALLTAKFAINMLNKERGAGMDATIKKHGHMIIGTETKTHVPMAYTVGLAEKGLPELVCFGLQPKDIGLLDGAAELLRKGELPLDMPFTKQQFMFKTVPSGRGVEYVGWANARARRPVDLIQMVWPDKAGEYPWSEKFDKRFREQQPCLFATAN